MHEWSVSVKAQVMWACFNFHCINVRVSTNNTVEPPQENASNYDKGVPAEILEVIMGKGLIQRTWRCR